MFAVYFGVATRQHLMPRAACHAISRRHQTEYLRRNRAQESLTRGNASTVLEKRSGAIGHNVLADGGGVGVEGTGRVEDIIRAQAVDVNVLLNHGVILGEGEHPQVRGGPDDFGMEVLIGDVDARKHGEALLDHKGDLAVENVVLIRDVGISEIEIGNVYSGSSERDIEVWYVDLDVGSEEEPCVLIGTFDEDSIVFQDNRLLDGLAHIGNGVTKVLRACLRIAGAWFGVVYTTLPRGGQVARFVMSPTTFTTAVTSFTASLTATFTSTVTVGINEEN